MKGNKWIVRFLLSIGVILLIVGTISTIFDYIAAAIKINMDSLKDDSVYKFFVMLKDFFLAISGAVFGAAISIKLDNAGFIKSTFFNVSKNIVDFKNELAKLIASFNNNASSFSEALSRIENENNKTKSDIIGKIMSLYNVGLASKEADIASFIDKKIYLYMITVTADKPGGTWVCYSATFAEKSPRCLTAQITSKNIKGAVTTYDMELFVRKNHLVLVVVASSSSEHTSSFIFPDFDLRFGAPVCGIRVGNPYVGDCILGSSILSFDNIEDSAEGFVAESKLKMLDTTWNEGFYRHKIFDVTSIKKADPIIGYWIAKSYCENGIADIAFIRFYNSSDQEVCVDAVVVKTDGTFIDCNFNSTSSKVDDNKLIVTYQRPNDQGSLGVAVYYFDNIVDKKYCSYVGYFTDDNTPYHTVRVAGVRIREDLFNKVSNCYAMKHKVNLAMFSEELSKTPDQHEQEGVSQ